MSLDFPEKFVFHSDAPHEIFIAILLTFHPYIRHVTLFFALLDVLTYIFVVFFLPPESPTLK